eukprot:g32459.t1
MLRGESLRVRCAPAADVGLALCSLMCMQASNCTFVWLSTLLTTLPRTTLHISANYSDAEIFIRTFGSLGLCGNSFGYLLPRATLQRHRQPGWLVNHHFYPLKITGCPTKSNSISATFGALGGAGRLFGTVQACVVQDPALFGGNFLIAVFVFSLMVAGAMYASIMQRWEERSAKHHPASQIVMQGMDEMHFTPDLVVPDGCECILLVPSKPKRGMTFDVIDCAGAVVLRMEDMQHASSSPLPRRRLLTPNKVVLGQCTRTQQSFPSQTSTAITFEISNATHGVFAKLTYEPRQGRDDKVFLETKHEKLLFFGSIEHQTLNLTDFCGRLLATTEPVTQQAHHKQHIPEGKTNQSVQRSRHPNVI